MIDTHTHLFVEEFKDDFPLVIQRAKDAGVERVFMPNIDDESLDDLLDSCARYPGYCYPMLGYHPTSVDGSSLAKVMRMKEHLVDGHPFIAIGEVGLDLYWDKTYLHEQQVVLDEQIHWALEWNLPVVIHCREAFAELFDLLEPYKRTELKGVFHSFTGTIDEAQKALEYDNFMMGINGVVTFKKSTLPEVLKQVPLDRLVLETDSPYLAPTPFRGKRNESSYVGKVADKLAEIYGLSSAEICSITTRNALKVFEISD
ncbi:MAG: TatD family hydrolase [Bacteroidaceae bacterium]|nr:TatD family hydrolase [Bacteroidaceae bacterium]